MSRSLLRICKHALLQWRGRSAPQWNPPHQRTSPSCPILLQTILLLLLRLHLVLSKWVDQRRCLEACKWAGEEGQWPQRPECSACLWARSWELLLLLLLLPLVFSVGSRLWRSEIGGWAQLWTWPRPSHQQTASQWLTGSEPGSHLHEKVRTRNRESEIQPTSFLLFFFSMTHTHTHTHSYIYSHIHTHMAGCIQKRERDFLFLTLSDYGWEANRNGGTVGRCYSVFNQLKKQFSCVVSERKPFDGQSQPKPQYNN